MKFAIVAAFLALAGASSTLDLITPRWTQHAPAPQPSGSSSVATLSSSTSSASRASSTVLPTVPVFSDFYIAVPSNNTIGYETLSFDRDNPEFLQPSNATSVVFTLTRQGHLEYASGPFLVTCNMVPIDSSIYTLQCEDSLGQALVWIQAPSNGNIAMMTRNYQTTCGSFCSDEITLFRRLK